MDLPAGLVVALAAALGAAGGAAAWLASARWIAAFDPEAGVPPVSWLPVLAAAGAASGFAGAINHRAGPVALLALALCGPPLLFLLATDLRARRIPVAGAAALAVAGLASAPLRGSGGLIEALAGALAGFVAAGALWAVGRVVARGGAAFGAGDVLLAAGVGVAVGWPAVVPVLFAGSVAAAGAAAVMAARGGQAGGGAGGTRAALPWGAYLCGAALLALVL